MKRIKTIHLAYKPVVCFFNASDDDARRKLVNRFGIIIEADVEKFEVILARYSQSPECASPLYCGAIAGEVFI